MPAAVTADFYNRCSHGATVFRALNPEGLFWHEVAGECFEGGTYFDEGSATVQTASRVAGEVRAVGGET